MPALAEAETEYVTPERLDEMIEGLTADMKKAAEKLEVEELKSYLSKFGELPPFNRKIES